MASSRPKNKFVRYSDSVSDIVSLPPPALRPTPAAAAETESLLERPFSVMSSQSHTMGHHHHHGNGGANGYRRRSNGHTAAGAPPGRTRGFKAGGDYSAKRGKVVT